MTLILSALLFSLSSNLDNIVVGTAYGIKRRTIGTSANLIIAIVTSTGTLLSMLLGIYISNLLPHHTANTIGALMIIALGVYFVVQPVLKELVSKKENEPYSLKKLNETSENDEEDSPSMMNIKETLLVAFGLTFNNLGTGVAASISGVSIQFTVLSTFIISILTILLGVAIGNHFLGKFFGQHATLISGLLLIILGVVEILN